MDGIGTILSENEIAILLKENEGFLYNAILVKSNMNVTVAKDITQDAMVKITEAIRNGKYTKQEDFTIKAWMLTIGRNLAIDRHRRKDKVPSEPMRSMPKKMEANGGMDVIFDLLTQEDVSFEENTIAQEHIERLKKSITKLPEKQQKVINLRIWEGLSFKEIAERSNVGINTALGRMRQALSNIRKMLKEADNKSDKALKQITENDKNPQQFPRTCGQCNAVKPKSEYDESYWEAPHKLVVICKSCKDEPKTAKVKGTNNKIYNKESVAIEVLKSKIPKIQEKLDKTNDEIEVKLRERDNLKIDIENLENVILYLSINS